MGGLGKKSFETDNKIIQYTVKHSMRFPAQVQLQEATSKVPGSMMLGAPEVLNLLTTLALTKGAKKALDVGTFTGASALAMALGIKDSDGKVVSMDINDDHKNLWEEYWGMAGVKEKIVQRLGPASDTLQNLIDSGETETFDLAFIDADKANYNDFYEKVLQLLKPRGIVVFDNTIWRGEVLDDSGNNDEITESLRKLNDKLVADTERVFVTQLYLADGATMAVKL